MHKKHLLVAAGILTASTPVFAAGFEKSVFWSGKYSGIAGAAVSSAEGAESLFWNPGGLADGHEGLELSGNISPTFAKFNGPTVPTSATNPTGPQASGNTILVPPFGAFASYGITPHWGIGIGAYTSAGTKSEYDNVDFSGLSAALTNKATLASSLWVTEFSLGTGYELFPGLKIGAAWRIVMSHASFQTASFDAPFGAVSPNLNQYNFDGLSQTRVNGFRLGAQYESESKNWGLGATWRTSLNFVANGNVTKSAQDATNGTTSTTNGTASAGLNFPAQVAVGGHYELLPQTLKFFTEWVWTQFHNNQNLVFNSNVVLQGGTNQYTVPLNWNNENTLRFGFECSAVQDWKFRAGYSWGNQVQSNENAAPILVAPGAGNTLTLGAGTSILAKTLDLDAALEYSWASGTGNPVNTGVTNGAGKPVYTTVGGDYNAHDIALNVGATYRF